jgi:hypothetical protein
MPLKFVKIMVFGHKIIDIGSKVKCTSWLKAEPNYPIDMCAMPIWSETTRINTTKTKRFKMCEGPGQPVLLGPLTCKCDKIYDEYDEI